MAADRDFVGAYARALRRRAAALVVVRALCASLGAGALLFAAVAGLTGPVVTPLQAYASFGLVALASLVTLIAVLRPIAKLRGDGVHRLLRPVAPELASPLRTAMELRKARPETASTTLIEAHADSLGRALARVPRGRVAGASWLRHPAVGLGATCRPESPAGCLLRQARFRGRSCRSRPSTHW